ncbi:two-component response regulator-like APRR1 isoform X2 [Cicer arietinum]|uniref:Two-component response regulator-like APRR1 isoform X2 n=1 Tax=Cicer arietinum TaxID=3827 RepID=A0A1S2Y625_CICAR|nr:two-component response regulator-like APRR1 isoform X2 [Cicer arietinum]
MESEGFNLNRETSGGNNGGKIGDGFVDRSKVRILLCDSDVNSSQEVVTLLLRCCYQVISVKSARQVIDALNAEGDHIDLILAEVGLPKKKGMKMLKYIARDKGLHRIPVIMMSAQDEVSVVVKCLKLGAADYLVKPLRTNELLNLWTHMWRRRRMLGLAEKNMLNYDFDLVASEPSDANTNSTTLFSDDTDDKSKRSIVPETGISGQQEQESTVALSAAVYETPDLHASECLPDVHGINDQLTAHFSSGPKKSELRIGVGETSAFFTYVKASMLKRNLEGIDHVDKDAASHMRDLEGIDEACVQQGASDLKIRENRETCESQSQNDLPSSNIPDSLSIERSCTPPASMEGSQQNHYKEKNLHHGLMHPRNGTHYSELEISGVAAQHAYPYYLSGVINHVLMPSSAQMYQKNVQDLQNHDSTSMIGPQYNHLPQGGPHATGMMSFPYYPMSMCLQPGQIPTAHSWPSFGGSRSSEAKLTKVDRREAALIKFRQKRKERCFDKKIRYVNRKQLAERRPRVRGQFVRKSNGANLDLNGQPPSIEYDDDEEDEDDRRARDYSPGDV